MRCYNRELTGNTHDRSASISLLEKQKKERISKVIQRLYDELGKMSFNEKIVQILFLLLVILWITRDPQFIGGIRGWGSIFQTGYVTDSTPVLLIAILFFILPKYWPKFTSFKESERILSWQTVHQQLPWQVVLLTGAGFTIAYNVQDSGLSSLIGKQLLFISDVAPFILVFLLCLMMNCITEVVGKFAVATFAVPILVELSKNLGIHPLYLMFPCIMSTSFAFMFPVASPPNALVFATGHVKISDMIKCGALMNLLCILVLQISINTYGAALFNLNSYPRWAAANNATAETVTTAATPYNYTNNATDITL